MGLNPRSLVRHNFRCPILGYNSRDSYDDHVGLSIVLNGVPEEHSLTKENLFYRGFDETEKLHKQALLHITVPCRP